MQSAFNGIGFSDADVVNPGEFIAANDGSNPHQVRPWLFHDHGFALAVVFAACDQDALDIAADQDRLDRYAVSADDLGAYGEDGAGLSYLGHASAPYDLEGLGIIELPNPPFSFCALFNAAQGN
jgi:hypothetical protein